MKSKILFTVCLSLLTLTTTYGQCDFKYGKTDEDSIRCIEEINSFKVFYNSKAYNDAYRAWQQVIQNCPCSWMGIYAYAQPMLESMIKVEKDTAKKNILIDSLLIANQLYAQNFPKNQSLGKAKGMEAYYLIEYRQQEYEKAYQLFIESIEYDREMTQPIILNTFFSTAERYMKRKGMDTTIIIDAYELSSDVIDEAIEQLLQKSEELAQTLTEARQADKSLTKLLKDSVRISRDLEAYKNTLNNIEIKFTPYAPCDVLEKVYGKKLEANSDNMKVIRKIVKVMSKSDCLTSEVFAKALTLLHKAEPSAQTAFLLGNLSMKNEDYQGAITYLAEAVNLYELKTDKIKALYAEAIAYQSIKQYSNSRSVCRKILELNPNYGDAYLLIGDLYRASGNMCGGDDYIPRSVSWVAADQYNRAKSVDPSKTEVANERLRKLSYPEKTQYFMRGLNPGDSYTVGCWIGETTRVR